MAEPTDDQRAACAQCRRGGILVRKQLPRRRTMHAEGLPGDRPVRGAAPRSRSSRPAGDQSVNDDLTDAKGKS